jgi:hypothetical protein
MSLTSLISKNLKIYRTITLPVLYGCETWSLTLREERRLKMFENKVLRRIFGPTRDEVTGEWRKLHNQELRSLYSSPIVVQVIKFENEMGTACSAYGGVERRVQGFGGETLRETDHWGDPCVDGRIVLRWIMNKWDVGDGLD